MEFINQIVQAWNSFVVANWYIFILLIIPAYAAGVFITSMRVKKIIRRAKKAGGVNFGETASIEITDKTMSDMWLYGMIFFLTLGATIALVVLGSGII